MSVDLVGARHGVTMSTRWWMLLLELTMRFGWQPAGLVLFERPEDDDGCIDMTEPALGVTSPDDGHDYTGNNGYAMTAKDRMAFADAIEAALAAVETRDADIAKSLAAIDRCHDVDLCTENPYASINTEELVDAFSVPQHRDRLRQLIELARDGEFDIC